MGKAHGMIKGHRERARDRIGELLRMLWRDLLQVCLVGRTAIATRMRIGAEGCLVVGTRMTSGMGWMFWVTGPK